MGGRRRAEGPFRRAGAARARSSKGHGRSTYRARACSVEVAQAHSAARQPTRAASRRVNAGGVRGWLSRALDGGTHDAVPPAAPAAWERLLPPTGTVSAARPRPDAGAGDEARTAPGRAGARASRARPPVGGTPRRRVPRRARRFLGDARFVWGPEGLSEADARLLGEVAGRRVLEIGAGAAQCSRWLLGAGRRPRALDLSRRCCATARRIGRGAGLDVPLVQADAARLPFADASFDLACSAYGGVPFVADSAAVMREVARVLRPGGRWVFSVTHPVRWAFPDDPGPGGLVARDSYFDRTPYVEQDDHGRRDLRRAPPHPGRPGPGDRRRRLPAGRPGRAGVAGRTPPGPGAAGARCGAGCPRHRDLRLREALAPSPPPIPHPRCVRTTVRVPTRATSDTRHLPSLCPNNRAGTDAGHFGHNGRKGGSGGEPARRRRPPSGVD